MVIISDTIRWKVVKMAHNITDDIEVAKMLLDCYDAIISGCLQWENDTKKKRIPYCTSEKGWELLEEIQFMMDWKDRQDYEGRNTVLTVWKDEEDEDDQIEDDGEQSHSNQEEEKVEVNFDSSVLGDVDVNHDELMPEDTANVQKKDASENTTRNAVKPKTLLIVEDEETSGQRRASKPKKHYPTKGFKKSGRPSTKAIQILSTPERTKVLECKRCTDRFTTVEDVQKHFLSHTESIIISTKVHPVSSLQLEDIPLIATILVPCDECDELTENLEFHKVNKHFRRACEICSDLFTSYGGWSRHMKTHKAKETGIKPHVCDKCGRGFALVGQMTMHRKLHSTERPHICETCGKCFKLSSRLMRHRAIHTDKALVCEYCNKTFNYKFNLKTHMRVHTGEKPFICTVCNKSYSHNSSLKAHAKSEHGMDIEFGWKPLTEFDGNE